MAEISEVTRRDIIDRIGNWSGRLEEDQFLSRLYNLSALPSDDYRFPDAARDIWQHRINNLDWNDDWIFYDHRFNLLHGSSEDFLRFLCETVHPVVRPDTAEAQRMVEQYNQYLRHDGWELFVTGEISGRPVFAARDNADDMEIFEEPTGWPKVDRQKDEIRLRVRTARRIRAVDPVRPWRRRARARDPRPACARVFRCCRGRDAPRSCSRAMAAAAATLHRATRRAAATRTAASGLRAARRSPPA